MQALQKCGRSPAAPQPLRYQATVARLMQCTSQFVRAAAAAAMRPYFAGGFFLVRA